MHSHLLSGSKLYHIINIPFKVPYLLPCLKMQDKMVYENKLKEWMKPVLKLGI